MPKLPGAEDISSAPSGNTGRAIASYDTSAIGRGIASFGDSMARTGFALSDSAKRREETVPKEVQWETQRRFLEFAASQEKSLSDEQQKASPGAFGFKEKYQSGYMGAARKFMETVPEALRHEYDTKLYTVEDKLTGGAGNFEKKQRKDYYDTTVNDGLSIIENRLYSSPNDFDTAVKEGTQFIDNIPDGDVGPIEKDAMRRAWREKAQLASLNGMKPAARLQALGESPGASDLVDAVRSVESGGDPNAVSEKGALGLMQVMPATGAEIAQELGDKDFPTTESAQEAYLKRPDVSMRYGEHYLNKMLARYDGDTDAALIAYNGGPARADAWLKAGRDDSVIPKESAEYYKKVAAKVGQGGPSAPDLNAVSFLKTRLVGHGDDHIDNMRPEMQTRLSAFIQSAPPGIREKLGVYSGARSVERQTELWNAALVKYGSADAARKWVAPPGKSNHNHGSAADLSYDGKSLKNAPADVVAWVHNNAANHGLKFPLGNENWHVELAETRGGKGFKVDPRFADMLWKERKTLTDGAEKELRAEATAANAVQTANYKIRDDAMGLDIELGKIVSEQQIINDANLDDGDIAKHLKAFRAKQKDDDGVGVAVAALMAGTFEGDPYSTDVKKSIDGAAKVFKQSMTPEQYQAGVENIVQQSGVVPSDYLNGMRVAFGGRDPVAFAQAAQQAQRISAVDPSALSRRDGGGDVQNVADDFSMYVDRLNLSPVEAAQRIIDARDPAKKIARKALEPAAKEFVKTAKEDDIASIFDDSWFGSPAFSDVGQEAGVKAEYLAIAEDAFYQANGDPDIAKARAQSEMKRLYGVSSMTGTDTIMKHPPDKYWPRSWYQTDGKSTSFGYAKKQLDADIEGASPGYDKSSIKLVTVPETDRDVKAGRLPGYAVMWKDANGLMQTIPGKVWRPDTEKAVKLQKNTDDKSAAKTLEDARSIQAETRTRSEIRGDDGGRNASLDAFIDGGTPQPQPKPEVDPAPPSSTSDAASDDGLALTFDGAM